MLTTLYNHLHLDRLLIKNKRHAIELRELSESLEKTTSELSAQVKDRDQQIESLTAKLQESQSEIQKKADDLSIALKLQMLRESDLEDLQRRYGEVLNVKTRQTELLQSMKERLSTAASYLHQLDVDKGPIVENEVTRKLFKAISGMPEE